MDGPAVFVWKKLESEWIAHWLPSQIRIPLVATNVSQLQETMMWVCSLRLISYQLYSRFLLFNMSRRWRKSAHCQGTTNFWNTIQHEIQNSDHAPVWCAPSLDGGVYSGNWSETCSRMLASVLIKESERLICNGGAYYEDWWYTFATDSGQLQYNGFFCAMK